MEHHSSSSMVSDRKLRIPAVAWVMLAGSAVVLLAIFVFKVSVGTIAIYGFIWLMVLSHLFIHGGHGAQSDQANSRAGDDTQTDQDKTHARHGGCH